MEVFLVEVSSRADRFLRDLRAAECRRIEDRLGRLAHDPVPPDAKFVGRDRQGMHFRYRIGPYRALYSVEHAERRVIVVAIDKRSRIYQG